MIFPNVVIDVFIWDTCPSRLTQVSARFARDHMAFTRTLRFESPMQVSSACIVSAMNTASYKWSLTRAIDFVLQGIEATVALLFVVLGVPAEEKGMQ